MVCFPGWYNGLDDQGRSGDGDFTMTPRNRGGRPSKFTTTTALRLVAAIAQSDTIEQAAESADVGASTVYRWVALGRKGDPRFEALAEAIEEAVTGYRPAGLGVREATEALALDSLQTHSFSPSRFWELMLATGLDFNQLYSAYVSKNVLNFFRQDNGYKSGSYTKLWAGREDNEHLVELIGTLDKTAADFADQLYSALASRYRTLVTQV